MANPSESSNKTIRVAIGAALIFIATATGAYWYGRSVGPTLPEIVSCKKSTCGPLELLDCGVAMNGPLFVYARVTGHYLGDCGLLSASLYNVGFCKAVTKVTNYCSK